MSHDTSVSPSSNIELEAVRLNEIFSEVLGAARDMLPDDTAQRFKRISNAIPDSLPALSLRKEQIRTFILMLFTAAMQNAREQTPIVLSAKANQQTIDVTLTITPNPMFVLLTRGTRDTIEKSLDASTLANASDPFVAFHAARMLGATIQINMWVETIPPDKAILHAYIPLHPPAIPDMKSAPSVLVIEDNRQISMLLELYLKHEGYETLAATNGLHGLETAKEKRPDLITLDVMMPEMDGWQALRELKIAEETRAIPVIVISVLRDVQIGFEFGASDYLTKPVNRIDLITAVKRLTAPPARFTPPEKGYCASIRIFPGSADIMEAVAGIPGVENVHFAESGAKIITIAETNGELRPHAFVLDARQDPWQALAAANRLRLFTAFTDVPVIIVAEGTGKDFFRQYGTGLFSAVAGMNELTAVCS